MDDDFREILENLEENRPRSGLEPYADLIYELRRRGRTYREIARILTEKCKIRTSRSTVNDFVRSRTRVKRAPQGLRAQAVKENGRTAQGVPPAWLPSKLQKEEMRRGDVQQRIAALKQSPSQVVEMDETFQYDPEEPLLLSTPIKKTEDA